MKATWPPRFRPRLTVEAIRWQPDDLLKAGEVIGWLMAYGTDFYHPDGRGDTTTLAIRLPDGEKVARPGDWIVRGVKGEFFPWPAETFAANYEPAKERQP